MRIPAAVFLVIVEFKMYNKKESLQIFKLYAMKNCQIGISVLKNNAVQHQGGDSRWTLGPFQM